MNWQVKTITGTASALKAQLDLLKLPPHVNDFLMAEIGTLGPMVCASVSAFSADAKHPSDKATSRRQVQISFRVFK